MNTTESFTSHDLSSQSTIENQTIRVLRFFREFLHISIRDLAVLMKNGSHSRSLIAAVEAGTRKPSIAFIQEYAETLEKEAKLPKHKHLLDIAQKCAGDSELLSLMDQYENREGGFRTIYNISNKLSKLLQ